MHRRQLLLWLVPALLLPAAAGRAMQMPVKCKQQALPALADKLKPFTDPELGKAAGQQQSFERLAALCEQGFAAQYRELVAADYARGATRNIDGWILSESEAAAQQLVYQYTNKR